MLQTNVENSELKTLVSYTRVKSKSYIITYTFKIASKALKSDINKEKNVFEAILSPKLSNLRKKDYLCSRSVFV